MKIQRLILKNFKCFPQIRLPPQEGIEFPDGLIIIQGNTKEKSNSFGKSSLVEALLVGFFGNRASELNYSEMITFGKNEARIQINFVIDNNEFMIIRTIKRKKGSDVKYFTKVGDQYQEDPSLDILELLQIRWHQASGTVFVKQGEIESLVRAKPAQLRDLIIKLFRLDITESTHKNLDLIKKEAEKELKDLQRAYRNPEDLEEEIKLEEHELKKEISNYESLEKALKKLRAELETFPAIDRIENLDKMNLDIRDRKTKIELHQKEINSNLQQYGIDAPSIPDKIKDWQAEIKSLQKKIQDLKSQKEKLAKEKTTINTQISMIQKNIQKMEKSIKFEAGKKTAKCPTCQREISTTETGEIRKHYEDEIQGLRAKLPVLDETKFDTTQQEAQVNKLKLIISRVEEIPAKLDALFRVKKKIGDLKHQVQNELEEFGVKTMDELFQKFNVSNIGELRSKIVARSTDIKGKERSINESKQRVEARENKIKSLKNKLKKMIELQNKMISLEKRRDHADLGKNLIKSFVTEYMVEKRLIKNINNVTSEFIKYFTGGQYDSISLTSGGRKGTSLYINVHDTYSDKDKEKKFLSGGDKAAIGFALRFGISDLMRKIRPTKASPKQNPRVDFLILDEPLGTLDTSRREAILQTLQSQDKFNQVFLITHTAIPDEVNAHFIKISKDTSTGLSSAELFINKSSPYHL